MKGSIETALVTGASRGLGRALAETLAARGVAVVLVARASEPLEEAVRAIRATGGKAFGISADIGDKDAIYRISGQAAALVGHVDLLIHNASTLGPTPLPLLLDTECEDLERVLAVNVVGPFRLTKAVAGSMALARRGTVVFISSDAATTPYPRWGAYGLSKAAADQLARILAVELEPSGVRIFSVDPGEMDTAMHAEAIPDADRSSLAEPSHVARTIVEMIEDPAAAPGGARIAVSAWRSS